MTCFTSLLTLILLGTVTEETTPRDVLLRSKRILFLGDSITASGQYVVCFEAWLLTQPFKQRPIVINAGLPSETVSGLSEPGHAGGKFPRPCLTDRLDSVLALVKPDLVFACYGINCGIYQPFDDARFQRYQQGILHLKKQVQAAGSSLILITPPTYDDQRGRLGFSYNSVLDRYAERLLDLRKSGTMVIDLHTPMSLALMQQRQSNPGFTFQPDAVHPDEAGHWFIASQLIRWLGDEVAASQANCKAMLLTKKLPADVLPLVQKRSYLLRDAYVHTAGHKRPGVAKGLPLNEAHQQADLLSRQIEALLMKP